MFVAHFLKRIPNKNVFIANNNIKTKLIVRSFSSASKSTVDHLQQKQTSFENQNESGSGARLLFEKNRSKLESIVTNQKTTSDSWFGKAKELESENQKKQTHQQKQENPHQYPIRDQSSPIQKIRKWNNKYRNNNNNEHKPPSFEIERKLKAGKFDEAVELYDFVKKEEQERQKQIENNNTNANKYQQPPVREKTLNNLIHGYAQQSNVTKMWEIFADFFLFGLKPDTATYKQLIRFYLAENNEERALDLMKQMEDNRIFISRPIFHLFMYFYRDQKRDPTTNIALFEKMMQARKNHLKKFENQQQQSGEQESSSTTPTPTRWSKFDNTNTTNEQEKNNNNNANNQQEKEIDESNQDVDLGQDNPRALDPTVLTYNILISHCGVTKKRESVEKYYKQMLKAGLKPNSFTYSWIIAARQFNFSHVLQLMDEVESNQIEYTATLFRSFLKAAGASNRSDMIPVIWEQFTQGRSQLDPNVFHYIEAIRGFASAEKFENALQFWNKMCEKQLPNKHKISQFVQSLSKTLVLPPHVWQEVSEITKRSLDSEELKNLGEILFGDS